MKIILIDDNISTTALLKNSLNWDALGIHEVFTAGSAIEAKEIINNHPIDIIICDIEMPGQNGLSLLRELRLKGNHAICIFLTAHAEFEYAKKAIEVDSIDYILKPFSLDDIAKKISRAVTLCKERSENNAYIKYGKIWMENQNSFTANEKKQLLEPTDKEENKAISDAKRYINDHYTDDITLQDIADYVHHSSNYLIKLFNKYEDTTPIDYLIHVRINQAKLLLSSNNFSISQVALMTGFRNIPYFNKVFKKLTGCTPSAYKSQKNESLFAIITSGLPNVFSSFDSPVH